MATRDEIIAAIRNADAAGDSASVRKLGAFLQSMPVSRQDKVDAEMAAGRVKYDPTNDMGTGERMLAGAGKAFADLGRGVGQLARKVMPDRAADAIGLPTQADIDEAKARDRPLMATTAGTAGNIGGNVAAAIPAVLIPGAQSLGGAAALGAAQGFLQPVASDESRLQNTALGGAAGAGGVVAGRALVAGAKGAKALVEPFTEGGRQAIAGRTLQRFGVEAGDLAGVTGAPTVTGARQSLAEQIARPEGAAGAARLQDSIRALDPQIAGRFAAQEVENNAARVGALRGIAGDDATRAAATAARKDAAGPLYEQSTRALYQVDDELADLLRRPAIQQAMKRAETLAANQGRPTQIAVQPPNPYSGMGVPSQNFKMMSGQSLQDLKMAMDEMLTDPASGFTGKAGSTVKDLRGQLLGWMEKANPAFKEARQTYAAASRPLNQQDVAAEILKRGTSATGDLAGTPRLMPDSLMRGLRDEERLIAQATDSRGPKTLADLFDPQQLAIVRGVAGETDRAAAVARAANGPGSATAQRMSSQNVLRQLLGPTGLPESWAESTMLNTMLRPVQFAFNGVAEPRIQQTLADLLLNPAKAQAAITAARTAPQTLSPAVRAALPYLTQAGRASTPAVALSVPGER